MTKEKDISRKHSRIGNISWILRIGKQKKGENEESCIMPVMSNVANVIDRHVRSVVCHSFQGGVVLLVF